MDSDSTLERLDRIEHWLEIIAKTQLAPILEAELSDGRMSRLYDLTGKATAKELAKKLNCSLTTVSDSWKRWERLGLVVRDGRGYRRVIE